MFEFLEFQALQALVVWALEQPSTSTLQGLAGWLVPVLLGLGVVIVAFWLATIRRPPGGLPDTPRVLPESVPGRRATITPRRSYTWLRLVFLVLLAMPVSWAVLALVWSYDVGWPVKWMLAPLAVLSTALVVASWSVIIRQRTESFGMIVDKLAWSRSPEAKIFFVALGLFAFGFGVIVWRFFAAGSVSPILLMSDCLAAFVASLGLRSVFATKS